MNDNERSVFTILILVACCLLSQVASCAHSQTMLVNSPAPKLECPAPE